MHHQILNFPQQFEEGLKLAQNITIKGKFNHVIVSGMGASAWPAEILTTWQRPLVSFQVNRNYTLPPASPSQKTLAIFVSYSGNTEECLTAYQEAQRKKFFVVTITSNGQLKEFCQRDNTPYIEIPSGLVPRLATGYIFTTLYTLLIKSNLLEDKSAEIKSLSRTLQPLKQEKKGQDLAQKIKSRVPLIYTSERLKILGYIWKIKFNENAKSPAFNNYFPELNHNELEGMGHENECPFHRSPIFHCLILKDNQDQPKIKQRMKLTAKIFNQTGLPTEIISLEGKNLLEKIFSSLLLADWTSYYLARAYQTDPLKTEIIDSFKKQIINNP